MKAHFVPPSHTDPGGGQQDLGWGWGEDWSERPAQQGDTQSLCSPSPALRPSLASPSRHLQGTLTHGRVPSWDPGGPLFQQWYPSRIGFRVLSGRALVPRSPHGGWRPAHRSAGLGASAGPGSGGTAIVLCVLTMAEGSFTRPAGGQPARRPAGGPLKVALGRVRRPPVGRVGAGALVTGRSGSTHPGPPRCESARSWRLCLEGLILLSAEI